MRSPEHRVSLHFETLVDEPSNPRRDADQKIGGWLLHRDDLNNAFGGFLRHSLPIEEFLCARAPTTVGCTPAFNGRHRVEADSRK